MGLPRAVWRARGHLVVSIHRKQRSRPPADARRRAADGR
jgi:hypothetical protein